jgi:transposase
MVDQSASYFLNAHRRASRSSALPRFVAGHIFLQIIILPRGRRGGNPHELSVSVRLIKDRGVSYVQASQDLNVHTSQLRDWVKKFSEDPQHAFPGNGQMKPEQLEITRLKREVAKLKAERDILKKAAAYFAKEST